MEMKGEKLK